MRVLSPQRALALNCHSPINEEGAEAEDWRQGKPVRVVRNMKGGKHSKYAPAEGNRYDGIYKVSAMSTCPCPRVCVPCSRAVSLRFPTTLHQPHCPFHRWLSIGQRKGNLASSYGAISFDEMTQSPSPGPGRARTGLGSWDSLCRCVFEGQG